MQADFNLVFTPQAIQALEQEGVKDHKIQTSNWPCTPVAGDLISWDWLCDGRLFIVESRLLIWNDPQTCVVQLLLGLPAGVD